MPYDWVHMAKMAKPKKVHPFYLPDRASVYWLDYIIDPRPQAITDAEELQRYYENEAKKFPSATRLSKPKVYDDDEDETERPVTTHGISTSALSYQPSRRIKMLSKLSQRHLDKMQRERLEATRSLITRDSSKNKSQNRDHLESLRSRSRSRSSSRNSDFGKGDYRSSSRYQRSRCQTATTNEFSTVPQNLPALKQRQAHPLSPPPRCSTNTASNQSPLPETVRLPRVARDRDGSQQRGQGEGQAQQRWPRPRRRLH